MIEQKEATIYGNTLANALGPGWTANVWENLGWHYSARSPSKTVEVYPGHTPTSFTAFINKPDLIGGQTGLTGHGDTPRAAVEDTVALTRKEIAKLERWLEGVN